MIEYTSGWIGGPEVILIVIVVLLLFGGRKIPELAKGLGKGIRDFKKAAEESDMKEDIQDIASEFNKVKKDVEDLNPKKALNFKDTGKSTKK